MIEYIPWSRRVLEECLAADLRGEVPTLDLDMTAQCTQASCIYCDSRPRVGRRAPGEMGYGETQVLVGEARRAGLRWIYSCGLGEPLEDRRFRRLVEAAVALGVGVSVFTNALLIDKERAKWLRNSGVCLIVKLDTLDGATFDRILGRNGAASRVYRSVECLLETGYATGCPSGETDLAFSIVPTTLNVDQIGDVVCYAKDRGVYPSVGELERAGRALGEAAYSQLALTPDAMQTLKRQLEAMLWPNYSRPVCPAIIAGVHIDNTGACIVDRLTGLNCKWFMLGEPDTERMGSVVNGGLLDLVSKVKEYRRCRLSNGGEGVRRCEATEYVFGGCGGSPRRIIQLARENL